MNDISQYSAIAIVMIFLIKEMFSYLKTLRIKKNGSGKAPDYGGDIKSLTKDITEINANITRIDTVLNNHISHLRDDVTEMKKEMGIMKNSLLDIKIALSKK